MHPPAPLSTRPSRPGRRTVLAGALGLTVLMTSACDVRLEDDAPPLPLIPTREPIPAEDALLWLLEDCRALAARDAPDADVYAEQAAVLRSALFRAGIPLTTLDRETAAVPVTSPGPTTSPEPTTSMGPTGSAAPTQTAATTATAVPTSSASTPGVGTALDRLDDLSRCGPGLFPVVTSLLSQRWAALALADTPDSGSDSGGNGDRDGEDGRLWRFPHLATGYAEQTAAAVYGFEIVAAQTREDTRAVATATLADLHRLETEQSRRAGGGLPPPVLGYALPFPVDSEASALRLAAHVLTGLTDGYGGLLTTVTGAAQEDAAPDVVRWLGSAAAHAARWGEPLEAFPGTQP